MYSARTETLRKKAQGTFPTQLNAWLDGVIAKGHSFCPSVCHTGDARLNGLRYRNMFQTIRENDISIVTDATFRIVVNLGVHTQRVSRREAPSLSKATT